MDTIQWSTAMVLLFLLDIGVKHCNEHIQSAFNKVREHRCNEHQRLTEMNCILLIWFKTIVLIHYMASYQWFYHHFFGY